MYKATVRWMIRRNVRSLRAGDPGPLIASYAPDAVLVFPGNNSWSGEYRGREAIGGFLRRFVDDGLVGEAHDILVNGPPWRTRIAVFLTVRATDPAGAVVYDNRAILFARASWGKITYHEDFEDTHKSEAFDQYLKTTRAPGSTPDAIG
jgi:ketosteroid isomerase-like protein